MAKNAKSTRKSSHGGSRRGSGRKPNPARKLRAEIEAEANQLICDNLPRLIANMLHLANGGYERVEEKWVPAGGGDPDSHGEPLMVLSERKVTVADRDRQANQYLIDRVLGRPRQSVEVVNTELLTDKQMFVIPDADDRPEPQPEG